METTNHIPRLSEVLYVGLCGKIGTPTQVKIRRDVKDTHGILHQSVYKGVGIMESGSNREGFRLATSDIDTMIWFTDNIVISDLSQIPPYNPSQTLIMMECHNTPPGFAKLQLMTPTNNLFIRQSCVSVNNQVYISSSLYREILQRIIGQSFQSYLQFAKIHGPCTSGFNGSLEYDFAFCFSCHYWPLSAYHWIERCKRQGWPSPQVLQEIVSDGYHLVAIGSGKSISPQQCETEWRMSFSQAEYKLVSFMNHTQFLCYGILKIFLKEVLNVGLEDPLLCSYFMKTTLFWKIQENKISVWCSKNMLHCVWTCFKYLTQCVYRGEFPNFFIPQNNMFISKVHGAAQKQLFLQLMNLYNMGFSCLLLSPSLHKILTKATLYPQLQVSTDETNIIFEAELDVELFEEIYINSGSFIKIVDLNVSYACVTSIDNLYKRIPSCCEHHIVALNDARNSVLVRHAFRLDSSSADNTIHATDNCRPLDMLIAAAESGFISDTLYVAMYLYNKSRYAEALYYTERTKQKLSQPFVLHIFSQNVNKERYIEAVGGQSLMDKIKKAMSSRIRINQICCIDEVRLEVHVSQQNSYIEVPPVVMTHMLSFLCHHHLGDRFKSRQSLDDLQTLLHYDEEQYIHPITRAISWQMLGICEQIQGDKEKALFSFQQSLRYFDQNINTASWTRIQNILSK